VLADLPENAAGKSRKTALKPSIALRSNEAAKLPA
jgi:hypothetical protein